MRLLIIFVAIAVLSCGTSDDKTDNSYYVETRLSFYDPYDPDYSLREWIRRPENIRVAHETLKAFGYTDIWEDSYFQEMPCAIPGRVGCVLY
jgi:hypothetical protein